MNRVRNRLYRGIKFTALEKAVMQVISLGTFFLVINNLSLGGYGVFTLLFSVVGASTTFSGLGFMRLLVADIATYRAQNLHGHARKLFTEYFRVGLLITTVFVIVGWFLIEPASSYFNADLQTFYFLLVLLIVSQTFINAFSTVLEGYELFPQLFIVRTSEAIVRLLALIFFLSIAQVTLVTVILSYVLARILSAAIAGYFGVRLMVTQMQSSQVEKSILLDVFKRHGKWESGRTIISVLADKAPVWIITTFLSTEAVAIFAFTAKIYSAFVKLLPVRTALFPILVHSIHESKSLATTIITKSKKYLFIFYAAVYVILFFFAGEIIQVVAPKYVEAAFFVQIILLRLFIDVLSLGQMPVFYALKQQKLLFTLGLVSIPVTFLAQFFGTVYLGLLGMYIGTFLAILGGVAAREYILIKRFNWPVTSVKDMIAFDRYDRMLLLQVGKQVKKRIPLWN